MRRRSKKFIDPRYFLEETTRRDKDGYSLKEYIPGMDDGGGSTFAGENKKGDHPLFKGMYWGNGVMAHWFKDLPGILELVQQNRGQSEVLDVAARIAEGDSELPPYYPFKFDTMVLRELEKVGLDSVDAKERSNFLMRMDSNDFEYNPPGW